MALELGRREFGWDTSLAGRRRPISLRVRSLGGAFSLALPADGVGQRQDASSFRSPNCQKMSLCSSVGAAESISETPAEV